MANVMTVNVFDYKERICVVIKMTSLSGLAPHGYHNGYVSVKEENKEKDYNEFVSNIETDEFTFSGTLKHLNGAMNRQHGTQEELNDERLSQDTWFLGFDSLHLWNSENPQSQTYESVKERTIALADEMIEKGI